jgi:hypothetical protein
VLGVDLRDANLAGARLEYEPLVERPLPRHIMDRILALDTNDSGEIVSAVRKTRRAQESKIRFDSKVMAAVALGIIDAELGKEITGLHTARNYIHIHAELRQADLEGQISFARNAYRRLLPFKTHLSEWRKRRPQLLSC